MAKIVVADDDVAMVSVLTEVLKDNQHHVLPANTPDRALELIRQHSPDLVLVDVEMPEGTPSGLDVLRQTKEFNRSIPVIMVTGQATKERAVEALRAGAQDFIEKPFQIDELVKRVGNALFQQRAVHAIQENIELKKQLQDKFRFDKLVGNSPQMEQVYRMIERVANTDATVLILGESGTGKELVARALHYNSRRAAMPLWRSTDSRLEGCDAASCLHPGAVAQMQNLAPVARGCAPATRRVAAPRRPPVRAAHPAGSSDFGRDAPNRPRHRRRGYRAATRVLRAGPFRTGTDNFQRLAPRNEIARLHTSPCVCIGPVAAPLAPSNPSRSPLTRAVAEAI